MRLDATGRRFVVPGCVSWSLSRRIVDLPMRRCGCRYRVEASASVGPLRKQTLVAITHCYTRAWRRLDQVCPTRVTDRTGSRLWFVDLYVNKQIGGQCTVISRCVSARSADQHIERSAVVQAAICECASNILGACPGGGASKPTRVNTTAQGCPFARPTPGRGGAPDQRDLAP